MYHNAPRPRIKTASHKRSRLSGMGAVFVPAKSPGRYWTREKGQVNGLGAVVINPKTGQRVGMLGTAEEDLNTDLTAWLDSGGGMDLTQGLPETIELPDAPLNQLPVQMPLATQTKAASAASCAWKVPVTGTCLSKTHLVLVSLAAVAALGLGGWGIYEVVKS